MRTLQLVDPQPMETLPKLNNGERVFVKYGVYNRDLELEHRVDVVNYVEHCCYLKPRQSIKTTPLAWSYTATFAEEEQ